MKLYSLLILLGCFTQALYGQYNDTPQALFNWSCTYPNIRDFTMTASGDEAYVTVQSPLTEVSVIVKINKVNDQWTNPEIVKFSGKYSDLEPCLANNDLCLYFVSNRPPVDSVYQVKDYDIWYSERENVNSDWENPINIGLPVNTKYDEFYPSIAQNNNLYFTSNHPDSKGKDDIFFSEWKNNEYTEPVSLSDSINTDGYEFNAFIAEDESYLLFSGYNRPDGFGSGDLYISFRIGQNQWSKALNLGEEINSKYMDYCPFVDPGTQMLYFTSKRSSFKEISGFKTIEELVKEINKDENGVSKIYYVPFFKTAP